jgi:hypothetical protein
MPESSAREQRFFVGFALVIALLLFAGFTPSFFARGRFGELPPLPSLVVAHGVLGTVWVSLFVAQAWLAAARRFDWHRRLGCVAIAAAVAFVVTGAFVVRALERGHSFDTSEVLAAHLFTNVAPLAAFAVLVACGIWQRRVPARHKRLMLLAAVVLLPPGIGRLFAQLGIEGLNLAVYAAFAFAPVAYDWVARGRAEVVSIVGAVALVAIDLATTSWLAAVGS